jgi:hypothetical protein
MDGYDSVLATSLGVTRDALRVMASAAPACSVIDAVIAQAPQVPYQPVAVASAAFGPAQQFIGMADRLVALLGKPVDRSPHWASLRHDEALDNAEVQGCRDDLRLFLRGLPEVQELVTFARSTEIHGGASEERQFEFRLRFKASMARLRALHRELRVHIDAFRKGVAYHTILNAVAHGIGGWRA